MLPRVYKRHLAKYEGRDKIEYSKFTRAARSAYNQLLDAFDAQTRRKEVNKYNEFLTKIKESYPKMLAGAMKMSEFCKMYVCFN